MKKVFRYILKEVGIHKLIAFKKMYVVKSEGYYSLYDSIENALSHKWTKEDILQDLNWQLSNYKEHFQY